MDRRRFLAAAGALAAGGLLPGCYRSSPEPDPEPTLPPPAADDLKALLDGNARFAGEFLSALGKPGENLIASPFGVSSVFGMVSHGARGKTLGQMRTVLHQPANDEAVAAGFGELTRTINAARAAGGNTFELSTANAVWGQQGFPWRREYLDRLRAGYGSAIKEADYAANAEGARKEINAWVERQTRDRIKDLVPAGAVDSLTRMVLVNALYFKAKWLHEFKPSATKPAPFTTASGAKADVPLMYQKERFALFENDEFQAIELPYKGGQVALQVFLPRKPDGLPAFEKQFTAANLAKWTAEKWPAVEVQTYLPKWKAETTIDLKPLLAGMGMPDLFDRDKADLSGMASAESLYVSAAMQKAFVDVNEEGTEAAAGTFAAVAAVSGVRKEYVFRADHPFLYTIRHTPTGAVLFLGRVTKP